MKAAPIGFYTLELIDARSSKSGHGPINLHRENQVTAARLAVGALS